MEASVGFAFELFEVLRSYIKIDKNSVSYSRGMN